MTVKKPRPSKPAKPSQPAFLDKKTLQSFSTALVNFNTYRGEDAYTPHQGPQFVKQLEAVVNMLSPGDKPFSHAEDRQQKFGWIKLQFPVLCKGISQQEDYLSPWAKRHKEIVVDAHSKAALWLQRLDETLRSNLGPSITEDSFRETFGQAYHCFDEKTEVGNFCRGVIKEGFEILELGKVPELPRTQKGRHA